MYGYAERTEAVCAMSMEFENYDLTINVPKGAECALYAGMPAAMNYFKAIDSSKIIECTRVCKTADRVFYSYTGLEEGVYHCCAFREGYTSVCQIIHFSAENTKRCTQLQIDLSPLAGSGYESGYVMLNTREFMEKQLVSRADAWGAEYAHLFQTPQFTRSEDRPGRHQQTTNEELWDFLIKLREKTECMHIFTLGKTPKYGFEMPLVLFTREAVKGMTLEQAAEVIRNNGKPTVQYTAQVHSNEPASCEGAMAMMLDLVDVHGNYLLDAVDVYIIPRINLDGAVEVVRHAPTTGEDMNRDYLFMNNKEIRMVTGAYNLFLPEACIDGHERRSNFLTTEAACCTDMELQVGAGSLNHPAVMTKLAMEIALEGIKRGQSLGLRSHFYSKLASAAGGAAGSSYYGTRNSLSFLVETPGGTTLGRYCLERRVMAQYVLASTVIGYTAAHSRQIMATVHDSREKMMATGCKYDETDLVVLQHGNAQTGSIKTPMIQVLTGEITEPERDIGYNEQPVALHTRPRPTAYIVPVGLENEREILRVAENHGVSWYLLPDKSTVILRQYTVNGETVDLSEERPVCFDSGAYVFPNIVPSTVLSVIMEPDFNMIAHRKMTLMSMGLVEADKEGNLPVYRCCRDLVNGRVVLESTACV